jgi:ankyrin repeat protein
MTRTGFVLGPLCALIFAGAMPAQPPAAAPPPAGKVDFATDVQPILRAHCVECHGPDKQRAGMRLDRKSSVFQAFTRRVVPGSSANSFLYHRIIGEFGAPMPPDGFLKADQIAIIKAWIEQGAEWPDALSNEVDRPKPDAKALALVEKLRNGDMTGFQKDVAATPSILNARGPEGSTPFTYAVLYTSAATVEGLLAKGADPNARNDANASALMWATDSLEKTKSLLAHGADVNAKSDDMHTALMVAARKPGNSAVVKLLLEHGAKANPNAKPETESSPLIEAVTAGDAAMVELLMAHGADAKVAGETGLTLAVSQGCDRCLDLLAEKVTNKDVYTGSLADVAVYGDVHAVKLMLDHGADVKAYDPLGRTALMYASMSETHSAEVVKLLIDHGADVNAVDKHMNAGDEGISVLDMAKRHGDTAIVRLLQTSGAKPVAAAPAVLTVKLSNDIRQSVQDTIPLLQRADVNFSNKSGCISCHNNSLTEMTMGIARKKGFAIDEKADAGQVQVNADAIAKLRDRLRQGSLVAVGDTFGESVLAYMLMGLHEEGYKADLSTDTVAMYLVHRQQPDGQWYYPTADTRPPLCLDHIGETSLSLRALQFYSPKTDPQTYRTAIEKAAEWLAQAKSYNNEDRSWRVAGLGWAGTHPQALKTAVKELVAAQKPDGGWADLPTMESTAYSTGKSLMALSYAGMPASHPVYQRGVKWLLSHQLQDGTWFVQTRSMAFQPYFDSGFPHGHDQWMSAAGTNWAAMALMVAAPAKKVPHNEVASKENAARTKPEKPGL